MTAESTDRPIKHDVAFSFLQTDEAMARRFATELAPLTSFVYSGKQEELAGTDGMVTFRAAFRRDSRVNVILYRKGWGNTPWTGIEQTAIQERCLKDGWKTVLVITLDSSPVPEWMPDMNIYLPLEVYPFEQAVGAIKRQVQQLGGNPRPISPVDAARRIAELAEFKRKTKELFWTVEGIRAADAAVTLIFQQLEAQVREVAASIPNWTVSAGMKTPTTRGLVRLAESATAQIEWRRSGNACEGNKLAIQIFDGPVETPADQDSGISFRYYDDRPRKVRSLEFVVDRDPVMGICWRERDELLSCEEVAARALKLLIDIATRQS